MSLGDGLGLAVLALTVAGLVSIVHATLRLGISPVPTSAGVRRALLQMLPASLDGEVHELGAGWGGLALALADARPRARVIAWEASWVPWAVFRVRLWLRPRANLTLVRADLFGADLSRAQAVVCYLWTGAMQRLSAKLQAELPDGAAVLSHTFALRGWTPAETRTVDDLYRTPVYRYVAARRDG
jgi:hypothetical protein